MHHSEDPTRRSAVITCYLDDSESERFGFIGGTLMHKEQYTALNVGWDEILHQYRLESIHMQDFIRPYGRYIGMRHEIKLSLFMDVSKLIRDNRIYSLSFGVPLGAFEAIMPSPAVEEFIRPYTFAFYIAMELNNAMCVTQGYRDRVGYLVDHGKFENQLLAAHQSIQKWEQVSGRSKHVGPMAFDSDTENNALQAADVIVWSARRKREIGLTDEFKPLEKLFERQINISGNTTGLHFDDLIPVEGMHRLTKDISLWRAERGKMPSALSELIPDRLLP